MRRHFGLLLAISLLAACAAAPLGPVQEPAAAVHRVLMVTIGDPKRAQTLMQAMEIGLANQGLHARVELDVLKVPDLPSVTGELQSMQIRDGQYQALFVDAIGWARAAQLQLPQVPIAFNGVSDPVGLCVVDSLARPGRNATGYMHYLYADASKRMEALHLAFPERREVLLLVDHLNLLSLGCDESSSYWRETQQEPCVPGPRALDAWRPRGPARWHARRRQRLAGGAGQRPRHRAAGP